MRRTTLAAVLTLTAGICGTCPAAPVFETELVGAATNNTRATAQAISAASFTTPVPPTVFNPPGYATATVSGHGGDSDVDFYSFSTTGGNAYFDIDNTPFSFDTILSLFDGSGTLIAFDDDSFPADPGSESGLDSFLGTISLSAGTYYLAVSQFGNFPSQVFDPDVSFFDLTRPDGEFGGQSVSGAAFGDSSFFSSGTDPGLAYTLHLSLESAGTQVVPEPGTLALAAIGGVTMLGGAARRRSGRGKGAARAA